MHEFGIEKKISISQKDKMGQSKGHHFLLSSSTPPTVSIENASLVVREQEKKPCVISKK